MHQKPIKLVLGKVQMEIEHLNAKINSAAGSFRIQFEGIKESLEPLKTTKINLEQLFVSATPVVIAPKVTRKQPQPDLPPMELWQEKSVLLDFSKLKFFSFTEGVEELLTNPLLDAETIEQFRWKFLFFETKLEALRNEIEKIQNRAVNSQGKIDDLIRNWLNPPDRILAEYREILQGKRLLREQIRDELSQNANLAKQYISNGLIQINQFFIDVEKLMPQGRQEFARSEDAELYPLLSELNLLKDHEYLTFWCSYNIFETFQLKATLQDQWNYLKTTNSQVVELNTLVGWMDDLLTIYESKEGLIGAKMVVYDKLTNREQIFSIP